MLVFAEPKGVTYQWLHVTEKANAIDMLGREKFGDTCAVPTVICFIFKTQLNLSPYANKSSHSESRESAL